MRYVCYVDGGCWPNPGPGAVGVCVAGEDGEIIAEVASPIDGETTNMRAEYLALSKGIMVAILIGAEEVHFVTDSQVMANQVMSKWIVNDDEIKILFASVASDIRRIPRWSITFVPREENARADWLVNTVMRPGDKRAKAEPPRRVEFRTGHLMYGWSSLKRARKVDTDD